MWRAIFWNFIIRTMLETYLESALTNMIKMYAIDTDSWIDASSSIYSVVTLGLMTLFCLLTPVFLFKKSIETLKDPDFIAKYGSLI